MVCRIQDCNRPTCRRGYCSLHYARGFRDGSILRKVKKAHQVHVNKVVIQYMKGKTPKQISNELKIPLSTVLQNLYTRGIVRKDKRLEKYKELVKFLSKNHIVREIFPHPQNVAIFEVDGVSSIFRFSKLNKRSSGKYPFYLFKSNQSINEKNKKLVEKIEDYYLIFEEGNWPVFKLKNKDNIINFYISNPFRSKFNLKYLGDMKND